MVTVYQVFYKKDKKACGRGGKGWFLETREDAELFRTKLAEMTSEDAAYYQVRQVETDNLDGKVTIQGRHIGRQFNRESWGLRRVQRTIKRVQFRDGAYYGYVDYDGLEVPVKSDGNIHRWTSLEMYAERA